MIALMFHSIGCDEYNWSRSFLSVNLTHFERFCHYLKKNKYNTIFLDEWHVLVQSQTYSKKNIVLTFDDGYLDNYVYVYPILKKYGLKGTIFVNPEFVDTIDTESRQKYNEIGFDRNNINNILGFLNWNEITEMDNSGVIDIQNHTMSHNKYFCSPLIMDFLNDSNINKYDWLLWLKNPDIKCKYMHLKIFDYITEGYPVFENDRSLAVRQYFPDEELIKVIIEMYNRLKNNSKRNYNEIKEILLKEYYKLLLSGKYHGRYETDEEMLNRYDYEISESIKVFNEKLNKTTEFLCWPGGGYNDLPIEISKIAGYKASTISSKEYIKKNNYYKDKLYKRLYRYGMGSVIEGQGEYKKSKYKSYLIHSFRAIAHSSFYSRFILKIQKAIQSFD